MELKSNYPVIIIGGGVSGSSTAIRLLQQGITPLVIEKAEFPREVVGEGLSPAICSYLDEIEVLDEINNGDFMKKTSLQLVSPKGDLAYAQTDFNKDIYNHGIHREPWGFNVKRKDFDMVIMNKAKEKGAIVMENTTVTKILTNEDESIKGVVIKNKDYKTKEVYSPLVIDCSGRSSRLAKQFELRKPLENVFEGQWANFAIRCYFKNINTEPIVGANENYDQATVNILPFTDCWYWIIPLEDNLVSIGFVARSKTKNYLESVEGENKLDTYRKLIERHPVLKKVVENADMLENVLGTSRLGHMNTRMSGKGFMCVGDAGFFADPAWATGVTVALITSKHAANVAVEAIKNDDYSEQQMQKYEDKYNEYLKNPFNSIRAYNTYYGDLDYVNFLVKRLSEKPEEMHLINAVLFDYVSHSKFNEWTYNVFKAYVAETGDLPVVNKVSQLNFDSSDNWEELKES
jgi:flavin-dependent dehydrogenase